jgi:hypothetical protein
MQSHRGENHLHNCLPDNEKCYTNTDIQAATTALVQIQTLTFCAAVPGRDHRSVGCMGTPGCTPRISAKAQRRYSAQENRVLPVATGPMRNHHSNILGN